MLARGNMSVEQWLSEPFEGERPFPLSRKARRVPQNVLEGPTPVQSWWLNPACPACKRPVVSVIRGVAQLACRPRVADDCECVRMLRATRKSEEARYPSGRRRPTRISARRLVRGPAAVVSSVDFWPRPQARNRPPAAYPGGEPRTEPPAAQKPAVVLKSSTSPHAKSGEARGDLRPPPVVRHRAYRCCRCAPLGWTRRR